MSIQIGTIALNNNMSRSETKVQAQLSSMGEDPSATDLMKVQHDLHLWQTKVQLAASINKAMSEALQGIVQKT